MAVEEKEDKIYCKCGHGHWSTKIRGFKCLACGYFMSDDEAMALSDGCYIMEKAK